MDLGDTTIWLVGNQHLIFKVFWKKLTDANKGMLSMPLSREEIKKAIFDMPNGKVCGGDGLPNEFYKKIWALLEEPLFQMYIECYRTGIMTCTMRKGIMSLIPKRGKDPRKIGSLRPLTLLSTDFKILAKALANRLKIALPDIVGPEQSGFMEGRHIHDNIRKTMDIIAHVSRKKERVFVASLDFQKCFDRIEHESIFSALKFFEFPDNYIDWIRLFFNNLQICTQNAGMISRFFRKTRGVNQGCPISPFCYNVIGAVMALLIKNNQHIDGIKIDGSTVPRVITQFADDTGLYLKYSIHCLTETVRTLTYVEQNTGLLISYEKTCIYRVGSLKNTDSKLYTQKNVKWSDDDIEMLGIEVTNSEFQSTNQYDTIIRKMEGTMNQWYNRQLPLFGKILIINSLMGSLLVYAMQILPRPTKRQFELIDSIILKYLWKGKRPKIPLYILRRNKSQGGLRLVDPELRYDALQTRWIQKAVYDPEFSYVSQWLCPEMGTAFWKCNLTKSDVLQVCKIQSAWRDIRVIWAKHTYCEPQTNTVIRKQIIWYNSSITTKGRFYIPHGIYREFKNAGVITVSDLIDQNCKYLDVENFISKFKLDNNQGVWFAFNKLLSSLPTCWKFILRTEDPQVKEEGYGIDTLNKNNYSKIMYDYLLNKKYKVKEMEPYAKRWFEKLQKEYDFVDFMTLFNRVY